MKKIILLIFIILSLASFGCSTIDYSIYNENSPIKETLIGEWEGINMVGKQSRMTFLRDCRVIFSIDNISYGDPNTYPTINLTYHIIDTSQPVGLDIIGKGERQVLGILRGILEIVDKDTIRIGFDMTNDKGTGPRPANYDQLDNKSILTLRRKR